MSKQQPSKSQSSTHNDISSSVNGFNQKMEDIENAHAKIKLFKAAIQIEEEKLVATEDTNKKENGDLDLSLLDICTAIANLENHVRDAIKDLRIQAKNDIQKLNNSAQEINRRTIRLINKHFCDSAGTLEELPFIVGEKPVDLPHLTNVSVINALTYEQVKCFLHGYNHKSIESVSVLKRKLANIHGISNATYARF